MVCTRLIVFLITPFFQIPQQKSRRTLVKLGRNGSWWLLGERVAQDRAIGEAGLLVGAIASSIEYKSL